MLNLPYQSYVAWRSKSTNLDLDYLITDSCLHPRLHHCVPRRSNSFNAFTHMDEIQESTDVAGRLSGDSTNDYRLRLLHFSLGATMDVAR
jgi:hypothetical protein